MNALLAATVFAACVGIGFEASVRLRTRTQILKAWGEALRHLQYAVFEGGMTLVQALEAEAEQTTLDGIFAAMVCQRLQTSRCTLVHAWERALDTLMCDHRAYCCLQTADAVVWRRVGQALIHVDREAQRQALAQCQAMLQDHTDQIAALAGSRGRLCCSMGALCGVAAVILML